MVVKTQQVGTGSPKVEVGEIDTRAPFESVRAAVTLFGEGAHSADRNMVKKSKALPAERVMAKETQLHVAEKELNKFKEQLKNAETTKSQALAELDKAKRTVEDLTHKLKKVNESKESAIKATEVAKDRAKQLEKVNAVDPSANGSAWKQEVDSSRQQCALATKELDAAKQELWKIRQELEAYMREKNAAVQQATDAENASVANKERAGEISREIAAVQESLEHVKQASVQAQQERMQIFSEKDSQRQAKINALREMEKKLELLKKDFDPEEARNLDEKLAETATEIAALQKELENIKVSDQDSLKAVTTDLDTAKIELQKLADEESSLKTSVESLKQELESVKKEHNELKEKEAEAENIAGNLHIKLQKSKAELEAALAGETKARAAVDELTSTLQQLSNESKNARSELDTMNKEAEELKKEAEMIRIALEEAEKNLQVALKEAEEAKAAEAVALDQIKILTARTNAARASTSESGAQITISADEYKSLSQKVDESNKLAEMKVAAAAAKVEAVKASESEALKRLEVARKEIEEMENATKEALKRADMAEAAKRAVEGELRRWREREEKRAAEAAARILSETEMSKEQPSPVKWNPTEKVASSPPPKPRVAKTVSSGKIERGHHRMEKPPVSKKTLLPNLSGIFQRKKSHLDGGSPSYLPGEKPV